MLPTTILQTKIFIDKNIVVIYKNNLPVLARNGLVKDERKFVVKALHMKQLPLRNLFALRRLGEL